MVLLRVFSNAKHGSLDVKDVHFVKNKKKDVPLEPLLATVVHSSVDGFALVGHRIVVQQL